jgi:tRNA A37 threonylcarbamoyladenosine dehydratase
MNRFHRTEILLGARAAQQLNEATVTIVGLGAVGSFAIEALARSGIGGLRLVDFDEVRESNINRQIFALNSTLGRPKAEVARERVLDINPDCRVEIFKLFVDAESAASFLPGSDGILVDAIDSLNPKVNLLAAACRSGVGTIISSMGAARKTNPLDIRTGDLFESQHCPLARLIRKRLRRMGISDGIRCVYSIEPPKKHAVQHPREADGPRVVERGRTRQTMGSLAYMTGIFGLMIAREVIQSIVGDLGELEL